MHILSRFLKVLKDSWIKKKNRQSKTLPAIFSKNFLFGYDVRCARPFLAHAFLKFHCLPFSESFETFSLNLREMDKQVFAALGLNKTITFTLIKPFNCTLWHTIFSYKIAETLFSEKPNWAFPILN
jgi:hypothetical protein